MSAINDAKKVAVVGSPSSNDDVIVDILDEATHAPLIGQMLFLSHPITDGDNQRVEIGLGVVTQVTQTNQFHANPNLRAVIKQHGEMKNLTGDAGDSRTAHLKLQAAYIQDANGFDWRQSGNGLSTAPPTGSLIRQVDNDVLDTLIAATSDDVHYLGYLHGSATRGGKVRAPFSMPDFNGPEGAYHSGVFGLTGSGKALHVDEIVPTPNGWKRMGDLVDGDTVFDERGKPCTVVKAHDVMYDRPCFEITFSDGSTIIADADHLWYSETSADRVTASRYRAFDVESKRQPVLAPEVIARLRAVADASEPTEVITAQQLAALSGLAYNNSPIVRALRQVGPVGTIITDSEFNYPAQRYTKTRELPTWRRADLLLALADKCTQDRRVFNLATAERLREASAHDADARIAVPQVAAIVGVPARNGNLRRLVNSTNLKSEVRPVTISVDIEEHTVTRRTPVETRVYPKKAVLHALADNCELPRGDQRHKRGVIGGVYSTQEIAESLLDSYGASNHAVPVASALDLPDADLLLHPYLLGVWLGDGTAASGRVTSADPEILETIRSLGYEVRSSSSTPIDYLVTIDRRRSAAHTCSVCGDSLGGRKGHYHPACRAYASVAGQLRMLGVLGHKHIPQDYMRASEAQRRDLLAGLLDTDGTVAVSGAVHFDNTNRDLIDGVFELAVSLGYRPTITEGRATLYGKDCGPKWRVAFSTSDTVFRLTRKVELHQSRSSSHNPSKVSHRYIVDARPVPSVPVRCITVDSPNSLYLAGKAMIPTHNTAITAYALASQLRHMEMGAIIVDPQGQWSSEEGFAFSVQGFAQELGRTVIIKRISEDLRLSKDAPLFAALLGKTKFMQEIGRMAPENQGYFLDEVIKIIRARDDWDTETSDSLLRHVLSTLITEDPSSEGNRFPYLGRVYSAEDRQVRLRDQIQDILSDAGRMKEVMRYFFVIHNLFQDKNPAGAPRESMSSVMNMVIKRDMTAAAPMLILDMSTSDTTSWINSALASDEQQEIMDSLAILDEDAIKAAILRQVGSALRVSSESAFRAGGALNTIVMLDEAWRYVPPTGPDTDPEIKALSKDFAGYARDWRKFGLGLWFITQSTRSINPDIWDQLLVRFIGYGLAGPDLERVADHVESRDDLRLYKSFAPPKSTKPRIYPWLVMGPVSPLSFTKAPIAIAAYTDFDDFRADNSRWISAIRKSLGLPILAGAPVKPNASQMTAAAAKLAQASRANAHASGKTKAVKAQVEQVRANRDTGGVNMVDYSLQSNDDTFGSLDNLGLDDEMPPVSGKGPNGNPVDPNTGEEFPF